MTELKPCPFCGGKAEIWRCANGSYEIFCTKCKLKVMDGFAPTQMPEDALVGFYNRRVRDDQS